MGTFILSTHTSTLTMGRAAKLKRQRKRQRLSSPPLLSTTRELVRGADPEIAQSASDLIDWLLEQWSTVPQLVEDFTYPQAQRLANEALYLFIDAVTQKKPPTLSMEFALSDRFTLLLFFEAQSLSIESKLLDHLDKTIFDFPDQFKL